MSLAADLVAGFGVSKDSQADDRLLVREAELLLYAAIDPRFDGVLSFAAHEEDGVSLAEIHEAYITSSKLIPRSRFKVGQYFLGIGRLNRLHRHEWPFTNTPTSIRKFFDSEGIADTGGEFTVLLPLPVFVEVTLGVANGWKYGHTHGAGQKPPSPSHYARLAHAFSLGTSNQTEWGLNTLRRSPADKSQVELYGLDFTSKWRSHSFTRYLLQAEVWHQKKVQPDGATKTFSSGGYVVNQWAFSQDLATGLLLDYYTFNSLKNVFGESISNDEIMIAPNLTWHSSEFAFFRLSFQRKQMRLKGELQSQDHQVIGQAVFLLGSHPAHNF